MPTAVKMEAETAAKMVAGLEKWITLVSLVEVLMVRLVRLANSKPADMIKKSHHSHRQQHQKTKCSGSKLKIESKAAASVQLDICRDASRIAQTGRKIEVNLGPFIYFFVLSIHSSMCAILESRLAFASELNSILFNGLALELGRHCVRVK